MFDKIKKGFKEVKRYMDKKVQMCKDVLSSRTNRAIAGMILSGLSIGLIASAYISLPA